ncbi:hypothetical protein [Streptomyces sp. MBT27]|uniref:hypothetical protein n=1 Tax=Streptomyces sp. MBT27 TaxID=1488356 RepID=UPI00141F86BF|nr:hypothetical protein [Streptomyces sp. MBT27]
MNGFVSAAAVKTTTVATTRRVSLAARAAEQSRGRGSDSLARVIASTAPRASAFQSAL